MGELWHCLIAKLTGIYEKQGVRKLLNHSQEVEGITIAQRKENESAAETQKHRKENLSGLSVLCVSAVNFLRHYQF